jgi:hypothetical protein
MPRVLILLAGLVAMTMAVGAATKGSTPKPVPPPPGLVPEQSMVLHRNAGTDADAKVTVGIPFPPGVLRDARLVRILDDKGTEVPAAIQATLLWYAKDGSVRAVRAQFRAHLDAKPVTY